MGYGFNYCGNWLNDDDKNWNEKELRLATESEVSEALINEAKRRGFKKGVTLCGKIGSTYTDNLDLPEWAYFNSDRLELHGSNVYSKGKWAEITPQEETIKIGGYEVKIKANDIDTEIDGNEFTWEFWKAAELISKHSKAKIMIGCSKQFDVSLETIKNILYRKIT